MHTQIRVNEGRSLEDSQGSRLFAQEIVFTERRVFYICVTWYFFSSKSSSTMAFFFLSKLSLIFHNRLLKWMFHLRFLGENIRYQSEL